MKRVILLIGLAMVVAALPEASFAGEPGYVGIKKCAICHKKEKQGKQFAVWKDSKHSKAFLNLGKKEAREKAEKLGVSGDPQKAEACLVCHTTGFGMEPARFGKKFKMEDGVQCEACHGAGKNYKKKKIMKKIYKERGPGRDGDSPTAKKTGLHFPNEKTCKRCHAKEIVWKGKTFKNPSYEPFDFKERFDKIKHPVPGR